MIRSGAALVRPMTQLVQHVQSSFGGHIPFVVVAHVTRDYAW